MNETRKAVVLLSGGLDSAPSLAIAQSQGYDCFALSVDYGQPGFLLGSGTSTCLDPDRLNAADAVLAGSWCLSASAYFSGDLGTPGSANDACQ